MNKQQFDNMDTLEQIQYINNNIGTESLTKYCSTLGINRSTITKRFKNIGYTFNKELNKYVLNDTTEVQQNSNQYVTIDQYRALEQRIKALENMYKKLSATDIQQQYNNSTTTVQQNNNNTINFYKGDVVVRAYRIDEEVYRRFKAYTDDNKQYKISYIISTALENFLNDYTK